MDRNKLINRIANILIVNTQNVYPAGLLNGKAGIAVFLYHYSRHIDSVAHREFADALIEEVFTAIEHTNPSVDFGSGLAGFGWSMEQLFSYNFLEGDVEEMMQDIDQKIIEESRNILTNYTDKSIVFDTGLYFITRFKMNEKLIGAYWNGYIKLYEEVLFSNKCYHLSFINSLIYIAYKLKKQTQQPTPSYTTQLIHKVKQSITNHNYKPTDIDMLYHLLQMDTVEWDSSFVYEIEKMRNKHLTEFNWQQLIYPEIHSLNPEYGSVLTAIKNAEQNPVPENLCINQGIAGIGLAMLKSIPDSYSTYKKI